MDPTSMFNGLFGRIAPGMCRLTVNGNIAVKTSNGYKAYNLKSERLTNVTNFSFDIGQEFFFVIPTTKVKIGDIILVDHKPKCVIDASKKLITVIDYENSEVRQVVPERHVFMGSTYFYGKIVSMFGDNFKNGKGMNNIMKMMMMSQIFGGKTNIPTGGMDMSSMMMMSMLMGGNSNPFEGMLDSMSFDFEQNEEDDEDWEEEAPKAKKSKKTKSEEDE